MHDEDKGGDEKDNGAKIRVKDLYDISRLWFISYNKVQPVNVDETMRALTSMKCFSLLIEILFLVIL